MFHRIEDSIERIKKLFMFNGHCYANKRCNSLSSSSRKWRISHIENEVIRKEMKDIMKRYGYEEPALIY